MYLLAVEFKIYMWPVCAMGQSGMCTSYSMFIIELAIPFQNKIKTASCSLRGVKTPTHARTQALFNT